MDELLTLLERYSPDFRNDISGVDGWALEELEAAFGHPLPDFYREFCLFMGERGGPLLARVDGYNPLDIIDFYRLTPPTYLPPRRFLYVLGDPSVDAQHYWLDLETLSPDGDCQVVRIPLSEHAWETRASRVYVGLRELLFSWAMSQVALPTFAHTTEYVTPYSTQGQRPPDAENFALTLEKLGFVRRPFPNRCLVFERHDAAIDLYRPPDAPGFSLKMGVSDLTEHRRLQSILEDVDGIEEA
ncbi:SMI1/KNR4 family protein [Myxococcus sp. CA040A]|uniref:SMI1/KNR4 family protein n=1 Tax=Myxococcus sp. CA040A TaxID=2741738 RepID=UPI00157BAA9C|nr:SMI1/KNR4 family protein [Myxococcus sp. CA040A]NTX07464.1 hypothetical protein [Myxococcus sp. CA040A]